jgi:GMP synthase-like glutamine amidotransferase
MKIAILIADYVNTEFLPIAGDLSDIFQRFFSDYPAYTLHSYAVWQNQFPIIEHYDVFVITGSRFSIFDEFDWLQQLKQLVKDALAQQRKVIGFCFGHQLLAHVLGGEVEPFPDGRGNYGLHDLCVIQNANWMQPKPNNLKLLFNHKYSVKKLPEHMRILAATSDYIQLFTDKHLALGLQAHPEYSVEYQKKIMGDNESITPYQKPDASNIKILSESVSVMQQWLYGFLKS